MFLGLKYVYYDVVWFVIEFELYGFLVCVKLYVMISDIKEKDLKFVYKLYLNIIKVYKNIYFLLINNCVYY